MSVNQYKNGELKRISGSGGVSADSYEEIMANTESGKLVGALGVKEGFQRLGGFTPVIDESTGQITGYTTEIGGADTVFPFSSGGGTAELYFIGSVSSNTSFDLSTMEGYENFTVDNFVFVPTKVSAGANRNAGSTSTSGRSKSISPSISYNQSTGVVKLSGFSWSGSASGDPHVSSISLSGKLYVILGITLQ